MARTSSPRRSTLSTRRMTLSACLPLQASARPYRPCAIPARIQAQARLRAASGRPQTGSRTTNPLGDQGRCAQIQSGCCPACLVDGCCSADRSSSLKLVSRRECLLGQAEPQLRSVRDATHGRAPHSSHRPAHYSPVARAAIPRPDHEGFGQVPGREPASAGEWLQDLRGKHPAACRRCCAFDCCGHAPRHCVSARPHSRRPDGPASGTARGRSRRRRGSPGPGATGRSSRSNRPVGPRVRGRRRTAV